MFRTHHFTNITCATTIGKNNTRSISFLKMKETCKNLLGMGSSKPPYEHVCQIGDPVLRGHTMKIDPEVIKLADFQKVIRHLINVMRRYEATGLAGPQIGLPWQIFAIEFTEKHIKMIDENIRKVREIKTVPVQIFINPQLKVTDYTPIAFDEACISIHGFSAVVPRAYEVEITALNTSAEQFTWKASGWPARMAQHEYDHLHGKLYVDTMDVSTFQCTAWEKINNNRGKIHLRYWPRN